MVLVYIWFTYADWFIGLANPLRSSPQLQLALPHSRRPETEVLLVGGSWIRLLASSILGKASRGRAWDRLSWDLERLTFLHGWGWSMESKRRHKVDKDLRLIGFRSTFIRVSPMGRVWIPSSFSPCGYWGLLPRSGPRPHWFSFLTFFFELDFWSLALYVPILFDFIPHVHSFSLFIDEFWVEFMIRPYSKKIPVRRIYPEDYPY